MDPNKQRNLLYKSEPLKYSPKLLWRLFNLHSTEMADRYLYDWLIKRLFREIEIVCYYRDAKVAKVIIGVCTTTYHNLKHGNAEDNVYAVRNTM